MLHGLRKKRKQPLAFYLICRSTKVEIPVNFLIQVLDDCHNARLVVVANVCDMGANNAKALKQLGVSEKTPIFRLLEQEIAVEFDPPHLLQCICNLFLKHEVMNVWLGVVNGQ